LALKHRATQVLAVVYNFVLEDIGLGLHVYASFSNVRMIINLEAELHDTVKAILLKQLCVARVTRRAFCILTQIFEFIA